jgi:hypothetical protein
VVTRDLYSNLGVEVAIPAQVADNDIEGETIDLQGFDSVMFAVHVGESGDTLSGSVKFDIAIEESDDGQSFTAMDAFLVLDAEAKEEQVHLVGYSGTARYLRLDVDATGSHTNGTPMSAVAIKGHAHQSPVN